MKVAYDPEADVLRVRLDDSAVFDSGEDKPGVIPATHKGDSSVWRF